MAYNSFNVGAKIQLISVTSKYFADNFLIGNNNGRQESFSTLLPAIILALERTIEILQQLMFRIYPKSLSL